VRLVLPAPLLGTAAILWAALPLDGTGGWGVVLVVAAALGVAAGCARLAFKGSLQRRDRVVPGALDGLFEWLDAFLQGPPWEAVASVALVVLEVLHPSRPWHTGILSALLTVYLLAVHRAEAPVPAAAFTGQARVMALSVALLAVVTGLAMLPSAGRGALSGWLEVVGAIAAMTAGGLAVPV
jgi:hypothetical protein